MISQLLCIMKIHSEDQSGDNMCDNIIEDFFENEVGKVYDDLDKIVYMYFSDKINKCENTIRNIIEKNPNKYLEKDNAGVLRFKKIKYSKNDLISWLYGIDLLQEEINEAWDEYWKYEKEVDEFRYCGYNEEDPNFRGMCLQLNDYENKARKLEKEQEDILNKIKKYFTEEEILEICENEGFDW